MFTLTKPIHKLNYDSILLRYDTVEIYQFTENDITLNYNKKRVTLTTTLDRNDIEAKTDSIKQLLTPAENLADTTASITDEGIKATADSANKTNNTEFADDLQSRDKKTPSKTALKLHLYLGHAAFTGIENDTTKRTEVLLNFKLPEEYGILKGEVIEADFPFVIELLNEKFDVIDTIANQQEFTFKYVKPGKYRLRLLKDINNNQRWDPGNPFTLQKQEEYIFFDELITIKANWEVIDKNFNFSVDNEVDNTEDNTDL